MKSEQSGERSYRTPLEKLNAEKLAEFLPGWNFTEKVFSYTSIGHGQRINENTGWIFLPPWIKYSFLNIEKGAKRVGISFGSLNSVVVHGVRTISARAGQAVSVLDFKSRHSNLSLVFCFFRFNIVIYLVDSLIFIKTRLRYTLIHIGV